VLINAGKSWKIKIRDKSPSCFFSVILSFPSHSAFFPSFPFFSVIPANAGIQASNHSSHNDIIINCLRNWIPTCAGMTFCCCLPGELSIVAYSGNFLLLFARRKFHCCLHSSCLVRSQFFRAQPNLL
jgi:hypothetical protein